MDYNTKDYNDNVASIIPFNIIRYLARLHVATSQCYEIFSCRYLYNTRTDIGYEQFKRHIIFFIVHTTSYARST